jgi:hypothetical protein
LEVSVDDLNPPPAETKAVTSGGKYTTVGGSPALPVAFKEKAPVVES